MKLNKLQLRELRKIENKRKEEISKKMDMEFINNFRKISIKNVCLDLGINYPNVTTGKAGATAIHKVRKELERRISILKDEREDNI